MALQKKKIEEGRGHLASADEYLKTSIWKLQFSPDWDSAADELNKAAVCFKVTILMMEDKNAKENQLPYLAHNLFSQVPPPPISCQVYVPTITQDEDELPANDGETYAPRRSKRLQN